MTILAWLRSRLRRRQEQKVFDARLDALARRDVEDTIAEEDVHLIVALLEAGARESAADKRGRREAANTAS
jgi:hypothetical protein